MDQEQAQQKEQIKGTIKDAASRAGAKLEEARQIISRAEGDTNYDFPYRVTDELDKKGIGNVADIVQQLGREDTPATKELDRTLGLRDSNDNYYGTEEYNPEN